MQKYFRSLFTFFILLLIAGMPDASPAKVYIDIDSPGFQQYPIAICDFQNAQAKTSAPEAANILIAEHVRRYLDFSGIFNILDKKSFLEGFEPGSAQTVRFSDWSIIGADFLLTGNIIVSSDELLAEIRLHDVARGQLILEKKYSDKTGHLEGIARAIAADILLVLTGDAGDFHTKIAFIMKKEGKADIYTINYDGSGKENMTRHQSIVAAPRWSPDGQYLAFTSYKSGRPEVYLRSLKTAKERKVAAFRGLNLCGSFSPDSKKLLLTLSKDNDEEIYVLDIDTLTVKRLTRSYSIDVSPAWSPDGKKIAFVSNRSGSPQIFMMDADGNDVKRITYEGNYNTSPSWSPRGGRIAYEGLINRNYQIFSVDEEGNNLIQLTFDDGDHEYPSWSPSGRQIVFISRQNSKSRIRIMNANGLHTRTLIESKDGLDMPAWSPRLQ